MHQPPVPKALVASVDGSLKAQGWAGQGPGSPCWVARRWAAGMPPAGSRPQRPQPSAGPPPPHASTTCRTARSGTRCSRPPAGRPPAGRRESDPSPWHTCPGPVPSPSFTRAPSTPPGLALTAAWPPGITAAMRTGESPRSVKPKPPSPRVTWMGPFSRQRFLAENTDGGPWGTSQVRGLAGQLSWRSPTPISTSWDRNQ